MVSASTKLADARCILLSHAPVYGFVAMHLNWVENNNIDTMGVRVVKGFEFECAYNEKFVNQLDVMELAFVIQHEVEHIIRAHCIRKYDVDHELWNIACDMTIHGHRNAPKIGIPNSETKKIIIPFENEICWVPDKWNPNLTAEEYYKLMIAGDKSPKAQSLTQQSSKQGEKSLQKKDKSKNSIENNVSGITQPIPNSKKFGKLLDDHNIWDSESTIEMIEMAANQLIKDVSSQVAGNLPGHWFSIIKADKATTIPWKVLLKQYISSYCPSRKQSILRRSRRNDAFGMPGKVKIKSRRVSVIVDVSGSVSNEMLGTFFSEIDSCTNHAKLDVLLWDYDFQGFYRDYKARDWKEKVKIKGRGGTDMAKPIEWLNKENIHSDCRIILTDGYCNWASKEECRVPTIACIYGNTHCRTPAWIKSVILD